MKINKNTIEHYSRPHRHGNRFYNHTQDKMRGFLVDSIAMFMRSYYKRRTAVANIEPWLAVDTYKKHDRGISITWIGHASFLIQLDTITILTDPIFGSPSRLFPRVVPPGISPEKLPKIDFILLSHNHRDHMDAPSLLDLKRFSPIIVVPQGDKVWFDKRGFLNIHEKNWWQTQRLQTPKGTIEITFLPAHHWSQRGLLDKNSSLWGSWMITYGNKHLYFAGDSAYAEHFSKINVQFPSIDIALLPIGPCEPREHMRHVHLSANEAIQAFHDLNAQHFIPMHWGTFNFGEDHFELPIELLHDAWHSKKDTMQNRKLHVPKIGQQLFFE